MEVLLPAFAIVLLASTTQSIVGFGFGMITMGLLPLVIPVEQAVPVVALLALGSRVLVLATWRRHIAWLRIRPLLIGALVGVPLGVYALTTLPRPAVLGVLGLMIVAFATRGLVNEWRGADAPVAASSDPKVAPTEAPQREPGRVWGYVAGVIGGAFGGGFNVGGPPAVIWISTRSWAQGGIKATLQAYFITVSVTQLALLTYEGYVDGAVLEFDLALVPALVVGTVAGTRVSRHVSPVVFRRALLVLLLALGLNFLQGSARTVLG